MSDDLLNDASLRDEVHRLRQRVAELESQDRRRELRNRKVLADFEAIGQGHVMLDGELNFCYLSPGFERISGIEAAECFGRSPFEIMHPDDVPVLKDALDLIVEDPALSETVEFRGLNSEGDWLWISCTVSNHFGDPDLESILAVFSDVTDRVVAEQEVAQLHSQLTALVDHTDECILLTDEEGKPVFFNAAYAKAMKEILGIDMRLGFQPHTLTPPDVAAQWEGFHARVLSGESFVAEHDVQIAPDETRFFETMFSPVRSDERVTGFAEMTREITERRRAEGELRETHARLETLVGAIPALISFKDQKGRFLLVNRAFEDFYNISRAEVVGKTADQVALENCLPRARHAECEVLETASDSKLIEDEMVLADGDARYFQTTVVPVFNIRRELMGLVGVTHDVTKQRRHEEERIDLERQFHAAQKLESLGLLAGGVAHDFNNLLMTILGNVDLVQLEIDCDTEVGMRIGEIDIAASRASDLCRQLLAYSGRAGLVFAPCDLSSLVEEMVQLLEVSISKKIDLKLELAEGLPRIMADPTQISQVIMNLVTNASEAVGDSVGTITVMTEMDCLSETTHERGARCIALEITDTGPGMPEEIISRVFDPFFTTKSSGRGLGLAAVHGILREHGGSVQIASREGQGSSVRVYFPVAEEASENASESITDDTPWCGNGLALVVDDEPGVVDVATRLLQQLGFQVISAANGEEGLLAFEQRRKDLTLILADVGMPKLDGFELAQALLEQGAEMPVILSSGFEEGEIGRRCVDQDGVAAFLSKPYRLPELRRTIRGIFD